MCVSFLPLALQTVTYSLYPVMLEAVGAGSSKQIGAKDWADIWLDSDELAAVKREIEHIKEEGLATPEDLDPSLHLECASTL